MASPFDTKTDPRTLDGLRSAYSPAPSTGRALALAGTGGSSGGGGLRTLALPSPSGPPPGPPPSSPRAAGGQPLRLGWSGSGAGGTPPGPPPGPPPAGGTPPGPPSPQGLRGRAAYGAGKVAGKVAKVAAKTAPALAGYEVVSSFNDYKLPNAEGLTGSAEDDLRYLGQGEFSKAGRNFVKGAKDAALDVGSGLAKTADYFLPGQPVQQRYHKWATEGLGAVPHADVAKEVQAQQAAAKPAQPAAAAAPAQPAQPAAAAPAQPAQPQAETLPDGWQSRAVDMGLGSKDNVQRITTPDGRTLYTNQASGNVDFMTGKGGGVSTVGTEGLRAKAAELAAQGQQGLNAPAAGFNTTGTVTARNQEDYDKSRAQYLAEQAMSRYGPRGAAIANTVLDNYQQGLRTREGTRVAEMRERGDMERARIGDETQRYGIDTGAQVSLRGQDMADRRAAVTAQRQGTMDAARLQLDAARLGLDRDKMTAEDADRDRKARGEAQTKLAEWVRSITPAGADNKPDTAREADVLQAANDLAAYQRQALAAMANDPNATPEQRKAAAARVQALQRDGAAALDEVGRQQLMQLIKLRDQARASKTPALVPWGTSAGRDASITDFLPAERKPGTLGFGSDITTRGGWDIPGRELENVDLDILGLRTK